MDIIETIRRKVEEEGVETTAVKLQIDQAQIWRYLNPKGTRPRYEVCQRVIDLWGPEIWKETRDILDRNKQVWVGKDVCLCLPMYNSAHPDFFFSVLAMWDRETMRCEFRSKDSMIARSRNHLAKRFLNTGATWSIWFDDDMIFPFGNAQIYNRLLQGAPHIPDIYKAVHTINRLVSWNRTVVGGCYWNKRGNGRLVAKGGSMLQVPKNALAAVDFVGTGCLAVRRDVYLDIAEKFPETMPNREKDNEAGFFTPIQGEDGRMWGEDESFCWRAKEAGHPCYLDQGIICGHRADHMITLPSTGSRI